MKSDVELIAKAEAVLDRTLAYQAAQAIHELKANLGIDIQQINLAVSPMPHDTGVFRVVCTIVSLTATEPIEIELTIRVPHDAVGTNRGTPSP
jgi:hypothetical protein